MNKFTVIFECKEVRCEPTPMYPEGEILTEEGTKAIPIDGDWGIESTLIGGAFWPTKGYPRDTYWLDSRESTEEFIKTWGGAPWYVQPNGKYEIVEIKPRYIQQQVGWEKV